MTGLPEERASESGTHKVKIVRRADGLLQLHLFKWCEEWVPDHGKVAEFWADVRIPATITDDLERARAIGHELLRVHSKRGS